MAAALRGGAARSLGARAILRRTVQAEEQCRLSPRLLHTDEQFKDLQTKYIDAIERNADLNKELQATKALLCNADLSRELQATKIVSEKPPKVVDPKVQIQEKREEFYDLMERHGDPWEKLDILPQLAVNIKPRPDDWLWRILRNVKYVKLCYAHAGFLLAGMTTALMDKRAKKEDSDPGGGQKLESVGPSPLPGPCIASPQIMDV